MRKIAVVAPHPDDETLGCGGALLRHKAQGDEIHWIIVTEMREEHGFKPERIKERAAEIKTVAARYKFDSVQALGFPTTRLDTVSASDLVQKFGAAFDKIGAQTIYLPFRSDAHSDHLATFDAAAAATKWFRHASISRVLAYETISETDFTMKPKAAFIPNVFIDVSQQLDEKIKIMGLYKSELGAHPFPRSEESIRALATLRGAASGCKAAESFMLLKELL